MAAATLAAAAVLAVAAAVAHRSRMEAGRLCGDNGRRRMARRHRRGVCAATLLRACGRAETLLGTDVEGKMCGGGLTGVGAGAWGWLGGEGCWPGFVSRLLALAGRHRGVPPE